MNIILKSVYKDPIWELKMGYYPSPFGLALLAFDSKGNLYALHFVSEGSIHAEETLKNSFSEAVWTSNPSGAAQLGKELFSAPSESSVSLVLYGTEFQQRVWSALLQIPVGNTMTYSELAAFAGVPRAVRAVASAVARNQIAYFVPCHRIIPKHGKDVGQYRWGCALKEKILNSEKEVCGNIDLTT